jgi:hypothetical protein
VARRLLPALTGSFRFFGGSTPLPFYRNQQHPEGSTPSMLSHWLTGLGSASNAGFSSCPNSLAFIAARQSWIFEFMGFDPLPFYRNQQHPEVSNPSMLASSLMILPVVGGRWSRKHQLERKRTRVGESS